MLRSVPNVPFAATDYPITIAEVPSASTALDRLLNEEERDEIISCLAFHPEIGETIEDTGGYRCNLFEFGEGMENRLIRVVYFFFDLNMPLYVLAVSQGGQELILSSGEKTEMKELAAVLVTQNKKSAKKALGSA